MTLTQFVTGIANAIRAKKGTSGAIPCANFASEIASIQTGTDVSDTTAVESNVDSGKVFYKSNGVRTTGTSTKITPSGTKSITSNGTVDVKSYASANVNVPQGVFPSGTKSITSNGTVDVTNYVSANVNVPQGVFPSGTINITSNGTHNVYSYQYANVNVPVPTFSTKTISIDNDTDIDITVYYTYATSSSVEPKQTTIRSGRSSSITILTGTSLGFFTLNLGDYLEYVVYADEIAQSFVIGNAAEDCYTGCLPNASDYSSIIITA